MTAGNLTDLMDQVGVALGTITGLRVYDFPPKSAQAPFAFVDFPDSVDYDLTYGRGEDRTTFDVVVAVANQVDRSARDAIAAYAAGSGAKSVKAAVEAGTVGNSARVQRVEFRTIVLASGTFQGAVFQVDVTF